VQCPGGQQKKQRALATVLGDPAISFEPLLSDLLLVVAHLPFPFRLAVLNDYQFVHGSGGRTLSVNAAKLIVSVVLACKR
jgi:hypothetical protein